MSDARQSSREDGDSGSRGHEDLQEVIHPGEGVYRGATMATRREFAAAAAATAAAAVGLGPLAARKASASDADSASSQADGAAAFSSVADSAADSGASDASEAEADPDAGLDEGFSNMLGFEDLTSSWSFAPTVTFDLPVGSVVVADSDTRAAVVQATESSRPLTTLGCLNFDTGAYTTVLSEPLTGDDYAPSECHITDDLICWVETNNATDDWKLYAAAFDGSPITSSSGVVMLAQGDAEWLPPQVAAEDDVVVWQIMPDPSGSHVTESSHAYCWRVGRSEGTEVWTSPGRFGCAPSINEGVLTIAPRVSGGNGAYYGITSIDLDNNDDQLDQLVLPISVKPFMITSIDGKLAFSIEANYGYGGTLGSMGYYVGHSGGPYLALSREPSAQFNYVNNMYVLRSQLSYYVIDPAGKRYTRIYTADNCADSGDYPATSGTSSAFVTYALVKDSETNLPSKVLVRMFDLK